jgi:anti-anti-sigma factor
MIVDDQLVVSVDRAGHTIVVTLIGEMDAAVEDKICQSIRVAADLEGIGALRVDASSVKFIDASGVRCLLLARQTADDHELAFTLVIASRNPVIRVLELCGLTVWFADSLSENASV